DEGIVARNHDAMVQLLISFGGVMILQSAGVFVFILLCGVLGKRVQYDLRQKMFDHLQRLSFSYFDRTPVGWIMSRVTSDSDRIADLVTWGLLDIVWCTLNISAALIFMLT